MLERKRLEKATAAAGIGCGLQGNPDRFAGIRACWKRLVVLNA